MVLLLAATALGAARLHHAALLTASINAGVSSEVTLANALEVTRRVAARFHHIEEHGPSGEAAPWPLGSDADYLLSGGDCGKAAGALGAVFASRGRPFRVIQVNLGKGGAGHIMFETPDDDGRWVLLDPIVGSGFPLPQDGRLMGIDEIRALPVGQREWLAAEYRDGADSLFAPYRRTNWNRLGPFAGMVRWGAGETWTTQTSLRAVILRSDFWFTESAAVAALLLGIAGVFVNRRATLLQP